MNEGPVNPPSDETPAPPTPPAEKQSWEVVPQEKETAPAAAAAPAPDYAAPPPAYAPPPMTAAPRRNMGPIIIAAVVVVLVIVAAVGYVVAGYSFASSRLDSSRNTYNTVVSHQNTITDEFNTINSKLSAVNLTSSSSSDFDTNKTAYSQLVSQAQAAQPTIASDDAALAAAQSSLSDNSWLTVLKRSDLDNASAKIGHERNALGYAKTIFTELVPIGNFFVAYDTAFIDLNMVATKEQAQDLVGAATAVGTFKTDVTKAMGLASAPGLPAELKQVLADLQQLATDESALLNAVSNGDSTGADTAVTAIGTDITKLEQHNYDKIGSDLKGYIQPSIDGFNSEVSKANSM